MARVKINQAGMRKLQQEVEKTAAAKEEANRAAAKHDTPEAKAPAFADVLRRHGFEPDEVAIRKQFQP